MESEIVDIKSVEYKTDKRCKLEIQMTGKVWIINPDNDFLLDLQKKLVKALKNQKGNTKGKPRQ